MLAEQAKLKILQQLAIKPDSSQRELAQALGISLGSVNYCLQALVEKGCIKMHNFHNKKNKNKLIYAYLLTPAGIKEKMLLTKHFLERKMCEYDALRTEIEALRTEVEAEAAGRDGIAGAGVVMGFVTGISMLQNN
jgi:EPS-associated MarR family transcriptional regulator